MNLFVFEHFTGGALSDGVLTTNLLCEGYGMLNMLIKDFNREGHRVTTILDSRFKAVKPKIDADKIVFIASVEEYKDAIASGIIENDFVYIIAPETDQILSNLLDMKKNVQRKSLNCNRVSIEESADKLLISKILSKKNIPTPETIKGTCKEDSFSISSRIGKMEFPLVIKPRIGAGCQGLSLVKERNNIEVAVRVIRNLHEEDFIVQRFVEGKAVSVCLISTGQEAIPLTLNRQFVKLLAPPLKSKYDGGMLPFPHSQQEEAFRIAKLAVESFPGLKGLVGVDLVITDKEPVIIEINPRITLSYIGLRHVISSNPAQMMIDAIVQDQLPTYPNISKYALFSKIEVSTPSYGIFEEIYNSPGVVSPPFPINKEKKSLCLLVAVTRKKETLKMEFEKREKKLQEIVME